MFVKQLAPCYIVVVKNKTMFFPSFVLFLSLSGGPADNRIAGIRSDQSRSATSQSRPRHQHSWHEGHRQNMAVSWSDITCCFFVMARPCDDLVGNVIFKYLDNKMRALEIWKCDINLKCKQCGIVIIAFILHTSNHSLFPRNGILWSS